VRTQALLNSMAARCGYIAAMAAVMIALITAVAENR
jgi:hypothetical protein